MQHTCRAHRHSEKENLADTGVDGRIIVKHISGKQNVMAWNGKNLLTEGSRKH